MYSRWFSVAVVLLWLTAMGWLMVKKVLPPLVIGDPPSYRTILQAQRREPPVGWTMELDDRPLGWALCTTAPGPNGVTEIRSRVHFDKLPLNELAPFSVRFLLNMIDQPLAPVEMDVQSTLSINPLDRLERFESRLKLDPLKDAIILRGTVDGPQMSLAVTSGDFTHKTRVYLPPDALVGEAWSPQTQLPGLRQGQRWTVPVYRGLRSYQLLLALLREFNQSGATSGGRQQRLSEPHRILEKEEPSEILQATVERMVPVTWGHRTEQTWLVVYRRDSGSDSASERTPRGKLWVRRDGTVLRQQVMIFDSAIMFVRLPDQQAAALVTRVGIDEFRKGFSR